MPREVKWVTPISLQSGGSDTEASPRGFWLVRCFSSQLCSPTNGLSPSFSLIVRPWPLTGAALPAVLGETLPILPGPSRLGSGLGASSVACCTLPSLAISAVPQQAPLHCDLLQSRSPLSHPPSPPSILRCFTECECTNTYGTDPNL